jgi:hypothetical protein
MNNEKLIVILKDARRRLAIGGFDCDAVDEAIAALSAKPGLDVNAMVTRFLTWKLPETFCPDGYIGFNREGAENAWPTGTNLFSAPEVKAMLRHMVSPCTCKDPVLPICDDYFEQTHRIRCCLDCGHLESCHAPKSKEQAKLPEVEEWIAANRKSVRSSEGYAVFTAVPCEKVRTHLQQLTAAHAAELASCNRAAQLLSDQMDAMRVAHAAELAEKKAEIAALKAGMVGDYDLDAWLDWRMDRFNTKLAEAKEQGRREALAYDPPIPAEIKGRVQAEWFWKGVLAMKQQTEETK